MAYEVSADGWVVGGTWLTGKWVPPDKETCESVLERVAGDDREWERRRAEFAAAAPSSPVSSGPKGSSNSPSHSDNILSRSFRGVLGNGR